MGSNDITPRRKGKNMSEKEKKALVAFDEKAFESLLTTDEKAAIKSLVSAVDEMKSAEEKYDFIGASALRGRASWVQTAIVVTSAFKGLSRKEIGAKVDELEERLHYKRAQVFNYRKAGEKLIAGDYESIPFVMNDFIKAEKKDIFTESITEVEKRGYYNAGEKSFVICFGKFKRSNGKEENKYFTLPSAQWEEMNIRALMDIDIERMAKENGKLKEHYFVVLDGETTEIDLQVVAL